MEHENFTTLRKAPAMSEERYQQIRASAQRRIAQERSVSEIKEQSFDSAEALMEHLAGLNHKS